MWILRGVAGLLLHDILAGIVRTFVAVLIAIRPPLSAEDNAAMPRAKLRLVIIWPVAPLAGIMLNQSLCTDITVQAARRNHTSFEHHSCLQLLKRSFVSADCR